MESVCSYNVLFIHLKLHLESSCHIRFHKQGFLVCIASCLWMCHCNQLLLLRLTPGFILARSSAVVNMSVLVCKIPRTHSWNTITVLKDTDIFKI